MKTNDQSQFKSSDRACRGAASCAVAALARTLAVALKKAGAGFNGAITRTCKLHFGFSLFFCVAAFAPVHAHEFWFAPIAATPAAGQAVRLRLEVGEGFSGEAAGFSIARTASLRHYTGGTERDLRPLLAPDVPEAEVLFVLNDSGTHLLSFDSEPQLLSLNADKFHAYLHDEGLDFVKALREGSGTAHQPGRERYHRNVKTLVQAGPSPPAGSLPDLTYATQTGQRLEITPLGDPLTLNSGERLNLKVAFDAAPLAGALVKAWHRRNGQVLMIRTTTSADGRATFELPYAGGWMVSVVHMVHVQNDADADWESYWGNVSFSVPERPRQPTQLTSMRVSPP